MSASAYRSRDDDAVGGQLQVTLTGASEQPVTVRSVALRSPGFETVDATPREITLDRGSRIDVTVPYGTALCDVGAEPATAVVETSDDIAVEVPLASQNDTLNRIHAEECAAAELADIVAVTLSTASCEPHVIADARKPFVFPAWIAVGDGVPVYTRIPVPVSVQRQLVEYQQHSCVR
ncbi:MULTISPECIES: hypothetical protein [unclassified Rhodococcus (in: high G+C Gram-positive bacteria)]|uniref:hypothetical protein n=1 Tax=unclassified Rhodococcus (in: high G+C Gram-positive bacteria) TaxID=192944 RepID=UPI002E2A7370|nr:MULTISPECIES: hypothetical protein [unclassified Rhodococcus (in: high G+C Gram-positive bacteria)]